LKHGLLPSEHPCTENLTPFIALLPCRAYAGLAQLLNPHKIFDANWQKIGFSIVQDTTTAQIRIDLVVETVYDPPRLERWHHGGKGRRDWNFDLLFGHKLSHSCPVADNSTIQIKAEADLWSDVTLKPLTEFWKRDSTHSDVVLRKEITKG